MRGAWCDPDHEMNKAKIMVDGHSVRSAPAFSIDRPAAVSAAFVALGGFFAMHDTGEGWDGALMVMLGVASQYLLTADRPPAAGRWFVTGRMSILIAIQVAILGSWLASLLADPIVARLVLLSALLFNGIVFGWAVNMTISNRRARALAKALEDHRRGANR